MENVLLVGAHCDDIELGWNLRSINILHRRQAFKTVKKPVRY